MVTFQLVMLLALGFKIESMLGRDCLTLRDDYIKNQAGCATEVDLCGAELKL